MSIRTLSPLDGRYQDHLNGMTDYFSEWALIKYRVHVEIEWLITLAQQPEIEHVRLFSSREIDYLRSVVNNFGDEEAKQVKVFEQETRHDVKAVEYFVRESIANTTLADIIEAVHFCCTSEDINNLAYGLMLRDGINNEWLPKSKELITSATN